MSNLVLFALKERNRTVELVDVVDGGALDVHVFRFFRVRSDERVQVATFELMRVLRKRFKVAHSVVTHACSRKRCREKAED